VSRESGSADDQAAICSRSGQSPLDANGELWPHPAGPHQARVPSSRRSMRPLLPGSGHRGALQQPFYTARPQTWRCCRWRSRARTSVRELPLLGSVASERVDLREWDRSRFFAAPLPLYNSPQRPSYGRCRWCAFGCVLQQSAITPFPRPPPGGIEGLDNLMFSGLLDHEVLSPSRCCPPAVVAPPTREMVAAMSMSYIDLLRLTMRDLKLQREGARSFCSEVCVSRRRLHGNPLKV